MRVTPKAIFCMLIFIQIIILPNVTFGSGAITSPFGIIFNPEDKQLDSSELIVGRLVEAGVQKTSLRLVWKEVEQEKNIYDWRSYDKIISVLSNAGLEVMIIITGTPEYAWGQGTDTSKKRLKGSEKKMDKKSQKEKFSPPPQNPSDLVRFISLAAERYKGKVKVWALYNAVQNRAHWIEPKYLAELYSAVRPVLIEADPDAILAMSGLESQGQKRENYLTEFLRAGGGRFVDLYDFHMFDPLSSMEDEVFGLKRVLKQFGQEDKTFQIGGTGDHGEFHPTSAWVEKQKRKGWKPWDYYFGRPTTPEMQADKLVIRMVWASALGAERILWAKLTDRLPLVKSEQAVFKKRLKEKNKPEWKVDSGWGSSTGILTYDLKPKPAYHALKALITNLKDAEFQRELDIGSEGKGYIFRREGGFIGVLWSWDSNKTIMFRTVSSDITVKDKYDHVIQHITVKDNVFSYPIGKEPIYIEGKGEIGLFKK